MTQRGEHLSMPLTTGATGEEVQPRRTTAWKD
jgi:hypothetical protein